MPSKYSFENYSEQWPLEFEKASAELNALIGDVLIRVHHIGSTSVEGLPAKPIIDLMPEARSLEAVDNALGRLTGAGYKAWGEYGLPGRRYFTFDRHGHRILNIHIYAKGDPEIERHVAFCAYLRHHEAVRIQYADLKRKVYAEHPEDIDAYNDGKDAWIKRMEPIAIRWYRLLGPFDPETR